MKWLCGVFLFLFAMHLQVLPAANEVLQQPATPAVEVQKPIELPPGGFFVALRPYFPKIPDLSKQMVPGDKPGEHPREMKPSEWLSKQTISTVEFAPADKPAFFYFPKEWKSPLNDKAKLVKGFKLAAPLSMSITGKDGKTTKVDGAILYQVDGIFDTQDALSKAYPQTPAQPQQPVTGGTAEAPKALAVTLIDGNTGTWSIQEVTELGTFSQSGGPLEEGWSDAREAQDISFEQGILKALGCFVATAVFESWDAPQLTTLRAFRDKILLTSPEGAKIVGFYYEHGPHWAQNLSHHPVLKAILKPMLSGVSAVLTQINLDNPTTQQVFHTAVSWFEWAASPLMKNSQHVDAVYNPMP